jgi:hypothetical protein
MTPWKLRLDQATLKSILTYVPETGAFIWRHRQNARQEWNARYSGKAAGWASSKPDGSAYWRITIVGRTTEAHTLAWLYMTGAWPPALVDHRDGNGLNNKWCNLRSATKTTNMHNSRLNKRNTVGLKGVRPRPNGRFQAMICIDGTQKHLGIFDTPELAHAAYVAAANLHFGDFARSA